VKHPAKRRRLRTVLQEVMTRAAQFIAKARQRKAKRLSLTVDKAKIEAFRGSANRKLRIACTKNTPSGGFG
jgi:hypothetical protein